MKQNFPAPSFLPAPQFDRIYPNNSVLVESPLVLIENEGLLDTESGGVKVPGGAIVDPPPSSERAANEPRRLPAAEPLMEDEDAEFEKSCCCGRIGGVDDVAGVADMLLFRRCPSRRRLLKLVAVGAITT